MIIFLVKLLTQRLGIGQNRLLTWFVIGAVLLIAALGRHYLAEFLHKGSPAGSTPLARESSALSAGAHDQNKAVVNGIVDGLMGRDDHFPVLVSQREVTN